MVALRFLSLAWVLVLVDGILAQEDISKPRTTPFPLLSKPVKSQCRSGTRTYLSWKTRSTKTSTSVSKTARTEGPEVTGSSILVSLTSGTASGSTLIDTTTTHSSGKSTLHSNPGQSTQPTSGQTHTTGTLIDQTSVKVSSGSTVIPTPGQSTSTTTPGEHGTPSSGTSEGSTATGTSGTSTGPVVPGDSTSLEVSGSTTQSTISEKSTVTNSAGEPITTVTFSGTTESVVPGQSTGTDLSSGTTPPIIPGESTASEVSDGTSQTAVPSQSSAPGSIVPGESTLVDTSIRTTGPTVPGETTAGETHVPGQPSTTATEPSVPGETIISGQSTRADPSAGTTTPIIPGESTAGETTSGRSETVDPAQSTTGKSNSPVETTASEPTIPDKTTTPGESTTNEATPGESTAGETTAPGESTTSGPIPGDSTAGETTAPGESTTSGPIPGDSTTAKSSSPGETTIPSETTLPGETDGPGQSTATEPTNPGESTITEPIPGETTLSEPIPGESTVSEPIPGETTANEPSITQPTLPTNTISPITTDDTPSTTITSLPPGAIIVTLSDGEYTSPVWITTTSPGGSEATVVPVIVPVIGPPKICFGCYFGFPPKIVIHTPEFCIRLLGWKVGNCPPDETDPDDGTTKSDKQPTSTAEESTSSCTTTVVATYESIFCSVIGTPDHSLGCKTQAWTTVTDCSVTNSATTTTSTATPTPVPLICEPAVCGGGICHIQQKRSLDNATELLQKRGIEEEGDWVDPEDYPPGENNGHLTGEQRLVTNEVFFAYQTENLFRGSRVIFADEALVDPELTTTNYINFQHKPQSLAVQGLYGCTSVVVVSKRGAWASHIWERAFIEQETNMALWNEKGNRQLMQGRGDKFSPKGLLDLINFPMDAPEGDMFGDEDDSYDPDVKVFIMTPRRRRDRFDADWNARFSDEEVEGETNEPMAWESAVELLKRAMRALFGEDVPIEDILYSPMELPNDITFGLTMEMIMPELTGQFVSLAERAAIPKTLGDNDQVKPRGKLLVQYHPAKTCEDEAEWRVYFEGRPLDGRTASWIPELGRDQYFRREGEPQKREECILSTASASASTASETETKTASLTGTDTPESTTSSKGKPTSSAKMPTLTRDPVSITTPSGSSCSETGTVTNCNGAACEENPTCISWVPVETTTEEPEMTTTEEPSETETETTPTTTSEPDPPNYTPLTPGTISCWDPADNPKHKDISPGTQKSYAEDFSETEPSNGWTFQDESVGWIWLRDKDGVQYEYTVAWLGKCATDVKEQDMRWPLGQDGEYAEYTAYQIMRDNFEKCNNGGIGGMVQHGCLLYRFTGSNSPR